jgi:hypothetical protein
MRGMAELPQHPENVGTLTGRCTLCNGKPRWRLGRHGDAVVMWACLDHLVLVLTDFLPTHSHRDAATITDLANTWGATSATKRATP